MDASLPLFGTWASKANGTFVRLQFMHPQQPVAPAAPVAPEVPVAPAAPVDAQQPPVQ